MEASGSSISFSPELRRDCAVLGSRIPPQPHDAQRDGEFLDKLKVKWVLKIEIEEVKRMVQETLCLTLEEVENLGFEDDDIVKQAPSILSSPLPPELSPCWKSSDNYLVKLDTASAAFVAARTLVRDTTRCCLLLIRVDENSTTPEWATVLWNPPAAPEEQQLVYMQALRPLNDCVSPSQAFRTVVAQNKEELSFERYKETVCPKFRNDFREVWDWDIHTTDKGVPNVDDEVWRSLDIESKRQLKRKQLADVVRKEPRTFAERLALEGCIDTAECQLTRNTYIEQLPLTPDPSVKDAVQRMKAGRTECVVLVVDDAQSTVSAESFAFLGLSHLVNHLPHESRYFLLMHNGRTVFILWSPEHKARLTYALFKQTVQAIVTRLGVTISKTINLRSPSDLTESALEDIPTLPPDSSLLLLSSVSIKTRPPITRPARDPFLRYKRIPRSKHKKPAGNNVVAGDDSTWMLPEGSERFKFQVAVETP